MLNDRLLCEIALVEEFKNNHDYLLRFMFKNNQEFEIEFTLKIHEYEYSFLAIFPHFFPYQPIIINKITDFKTEHSYKNGSMCLKWGNDNWDKRITLTMLIENLYELLEKENPLGDIHHQSESGEEFSLGQKILYTDEECIIIPIDVLDYTCEKKGKLKLSKKVCESNKIIYTIKSIDDRRLTNISINTDDIEMDYIMYPKNKNDFDLKKLNYLLLKYKVKNDKCIIFTKDNFGLFVRKSNEKNCYLDVIVDSKEIKNRINLSDQIKNKKIVILGLGSVGSRVAMDLARAGFKNFYFVDNDVMMSYNIIRHELTNSSVGEYKVNEIRKKIINEINSEAIIDCSTLNMLGQESSVAVDIFLSKCANADLIIDCTANDNLLLMLDKVCKDKKIPFISGTIIPGGLGNVILYSNGSDEKNIESILASFYEWKNSVNIFATKSFDYSATIDDQPFIATMSDCSILSGLLGKYAVKILNGEELDVSNITVFSTSNYADLKSFYTTYNINANNLENINSQLDEELIKKGKEIYEDFNKR